jgi:hypothetical protein
MLETERLQAQQGRGVYYDGRWIDVADQRWNICWSVRSLTFVVQIR